MPRHTRFTDEEKDFIGRSASHVWSEVAYDLLTAVAEDKGKDINSVSIPRSHVIEIALDAGRAEDMMRRSKSPLYTEDFQRRLREASYRELIAIVRPHFPDSRYGL